MSKQEPFAEIETEMLSSALIQCDLNDGSEFEFDLAKALGDFEDSVEIISAHRRDTLRG